MIKIARITFREIINKKIFLAVLILSILCYSLYGFALYKLNQSLNTDMNMTRPILLSQFFSLGLFFSTFAVSLMAVFMPVATISGEIENGILQAIVPQPIRRRDIILGKFIGYALMVIIYSSIVYFLVLFLNMNITGFNPGSILPGLFYFNLVGLVLVTITLLGSTLMSTMANGVSVILLFIIGMIGGMIEQLSNLVNGLPSTVNTEVISNIGIISSLIIPTDAMYRKSVAAVLIDPNIPINTMVANPFGASKPASMAMVIYTMVYIATLLFLAVRKFNKKDI